MAKNPISNYDELEQKIKEVKPGDHLCCIYETEEEHRAILTPFLREGFHSGQKIVYIVDARTAEEIFSYMHEDGLDVEDYVKAGQWNVLSVDDSYMRGGVFDPAGMISLLESETRRALAEGYTALRVTGEMSWALRGLPGSDRLIEYEIKLNEFFPHHKCSAICQYDRRRFEPGLLLDVLTTHPIAIIGTEVFDNFYYMTPKDILGPSPEGARFNNWLDHLAVQKRTQAALQESEATLKAMTNASTAPVSLIDTAGTILNLNEASARSLGKRADELLGQCIYEQFPPDVSARRRVYAEEVIRKGKSLHFEDERQGRRFENWVYPVMDADGKVAKLAIYVLDITERKRAEEALRKSHEELEKRVEERTTELRRVSSRLLKAHEEERRHIALEIHDGLGQSLSAMKFRVEMAIQEMRKQGRATGVKKFDPLVPLVQEAVEEVRRIQRNLRPPMLDDLGILATISWFCREFETIYEGIRIEKEVHIQESDLPGSLKIVIFRILQEALNNIAKHSQASLVHLSLIKNDGRVSFTVQDNGVGFDVSEELQRISPQRGFGLVSMKERTELSGGSFSIESERGLGTTIQVSWPCN